MFFENHSENLVKLPAVRQWGDKIPKEDPPYVIPAENKLICTKYFIIFLIVTNVQNEYHTPKKRTKIPTSINQKKITERK